MINVKSTSNPSGSPARFPTTHESEIRRAGKGSTPSAREAFGRFYEAYRSPLLAYLRREGRPEPEAHDLLHAFIEFLLENRSLASSTARADFAPGC